METHSLKTERFSNKALMAFIVPLFCEQFLVMLVGIADTLIVSYAGEAAVSGVSLVNQFNNIFIYLYAALASGGAVVISQYIGRRDRANGSKSSSQLLLFSTVFSLIMAVFVLAFARPILSLLFGQVEVDVMEACMTYLRISAYSYPFIAIYNSGAATFRSLGKTKVTMVISLFSNLINVVGNLLGVFVFHAGVAGVAWPSLIARAFSALVITILAFFPKHDVSYQKEWLSKFSWPMLQRILHIAIPNGLEDGIFQLVKVGLSSIVAMFGTLQIAANGVAQSIWSMAALAGVTMSPVFITVIGQCMGEGDIENAKFFFKKLLKITLIFSSVWNLLILAGCPAFLGVYSLSAQTKTLVFWLVVIHNVFNALFFPFSGTLAAGLRAAGDVRFTMIVSICSTVFIRLVFSWLLGVMFRLGVIGVALAMAMDWGVRAVIFYGRFRSGKWSQFKVI